MMRRAACATNRLDAANQPLLNTLTVPPPQMPKSARRTGGGTAAPPTISAGIFAMRLADRGHRRAVKDVARTSSMSPPQRRDQTP
jgi:hypothetical protein